MKVILLILLLALPAMARSGVKKRGKGRHPITIQRSPSDSTRRVATQKFSGLKLKGQLKKPDLSYIYKRKGLRADQVVEVPNDFNGEIVESALSF